MSITLSPDAASELRGHLTKDREHFAREARTATLAGDRDDAATYAERIGHMLDSLDAGTLRNVPPALHRFMRERLREIVFEGTGHAAEFGALLDSLDADERHD